MKTRAKSSAGFTLVEVLIALAMLGVVLLAAAASTTKYLGVITRNRMRIQAAALADAQIAKVRVSPGVRLAHGPVRQHPQRSSLSGLHPLDPGHPYRGGNHHRCDQDQGHRIGPSAQHPGGALRHHRCSVNSELP